MALRRMTLHDFVIVDTLELEFAVGFTALTGETGAGKSILVDALQLVMGARADSGVVRSGADRADLIAEFDQLDSVREWLDEGGFESEDILLLRRTIEFSGKSRGWINGTPATATQLRALGAKLIDIHGQHAWQNLMTPRSLRSLLDAYAGADVSPVQTSWNRWREAVRVLETARARQSTADEESDRLRWQISELATLAPGETEWDDLNAQHTRLGHAQSLLEAAQAASDVLESDETGARELLARAHEAMLSHEHLEPRFKSISALLADSLSQTEEALRELHSYLRRDMFDAHQLKQIDERVSLWIGLARRFKRPPAELPELLKVWNAALAQLDASHDLETLQTRARTAQQQYESQAAALTQLRNASAGPLSDAITSLLQTLGMAGGSFTVQLLPLSQPGPFGVEEIEFLVAGHAGQELRSVAKVASGGELSRIALAIAVTTSALGDASTLIFDEVDAGVGGAVAHTVGQLMQRLGTSHQVLAVTHLAQVAAYANQHLVVTKRRAAQGIAGAVSAVTETGRTAEIARMLGGVDGSNTSLAHAQEMLDLASSELRKKPRL